jgi:DnaK suppressor protein
MLDTIERNAELRLILTRRRRELQDDVQGRIRDGRTDRAGGGGDEIEHSDADTQGDLELALLQMKAEILARLDEALARLDAGKYGSCFDCERDISDRRLRALPFAVRCQPCEDQRERERLQRLAAERRSGVARFAGMAGA